MILGILRPLVTLDEDPKDGYDGFIGGKDALGSNLYLWTDNNPVTRVDPSGQSWFSMFIAFSGFVRAATQAIRTVINRMYWTIGEARARADGSGEARRALEQARQAQAGARAAMEAARRLAAALLGRGAFEGRVRAFASRFNGQASQRIPTITPIRKGREKQNWSKDPYLHSLLGDAEQSAGSFMAWTGTAGLVASKGTCAQCAALGAAGTILAYDSTKRTSDALNEEYKTGKTGLGEYWFWQTVNYAGLTPPPYGNVISGGKAAWDGLNFLGNQFPDL